jgi:general secretion pathway protein L
MFTCYIFTDQFDDENCLSVRLDSKGLVDEPLRFRTIAEFKSLQENSKTIVVLPTKMCSIHELELPFINENKARQALSYALEDDLAQSVSTLHFSFDREHYKHNRYLVVVIDKTILLDLKHKLARLDINYNEITNDWFALNLGESGIIGNSILVSDINFKGALSVDLLDTYLKGQTSFSHILIFNDTQALVHADKFTKIDMESHTWVATKLFQQKPMNLCQGEFKHNTNQEDAKRWYKLAAILGSVWVCGLLLTNLTMWFALKSELADYDKKIAVVYRKFFPEAQQVISPKFRINQLLKKNQSGFDGLVWKLLIKLANAINPSDTRIATFKDGDFVTVQQIRFQNSMLSVILECSDFSVLAVIEKRLAIEQVRVRKTGAAKKGDIITATLELG